MHCDSGVSFPEKVCNESGLSANVCEGGPFLCGCLFSGRGSGGMSWGGGFVCVDREPIVQHDIMHSVKLFFVFIILQVVCVQPIV